MTLTIPVDRTSGEPVFRQIYTFLRSAILQGVLRAGEQLPSTRDLAEQLAISRTTVVTAYEHLLAEGFIVSRAGARTVVAEVVDSRNDRLRAGRHLTAEIRLSRFGKAAEKSAVSRSERTHPRYDFVYSRNAVEMFPFEAWRRLLQQQTRQISARTLDYGDPNGSPALREAIASHLRKSRAVVCEADQVIIVNGSQQALDLSARVLVDPGDTVALEDPHYLGAREVLAAAGARVHFIPADNDGLQTKALAGSNARLVFTTPSHQFPTGVVLSLQRRLELLAWAEQAQAVILEDDYDGEFHYEGQPLESMQGLDATGRVVYTGTFSRTIFPSLRIGYLIVPKSLIRPFTAAKWLCDRHTAALEQATLATFIASGAYERHLRKLRKRNALRREVLLAAIERYVGTSKAELTGEKSGAHVVLWPRKVLDEHDLVRRAAALGVGVYGIAPYFAPGARSKRAGLLLGFSRMSVEDIREGIRRLAKALRETATAVGS